MAAGLELLAKVEEVVDLTIQDHADRPVLIGNRGIALDQVDDREPVLGNRTEPTGKVTVGVRTPVTLAGQLGLNRVLEMFGRTADRS